MTFCVSGQCCLGAKHFVSTWLSNYLSTLSANVEVEETILLDSIMLYNYSQAFETTLFVFMFSSHYNT